MNDIESLMKLDEKLKMEQKLYKLRKQALEELLDTATRPNEPERETKVAYYAKKYQNIDGNYQTLQKEIYGR